MLKPFVISDELVLFAYCEAAGKPVDLHHPREAAEVLDVLLAVTEVPDPAPHLSVVSRRDLKVIKENV